MDEHRIFRVVPFLYVGAVHEIAAVDAHVSLSGKRFFQLRQRRTPSIVPLRRMRRYIPALHADVLYLFRWNEGRTRSDGNAQHGAAACV